MPRTMQVVNILINDTIILRTRIQSFRVVLNHCTIIIRVDFPRGGGGDINSEYICIWGYQWNKEGFLYINDESGLLAAGCMHAAELIKRHRPNQTDRYDLSINTSSQYQSIIKKINVHVHQAIIKVWQVAIYI